MPKRKRNQDKKIQETGTLKPKKRPDNLCDRKIEANGKANTTTFGFEFFSWDDFFSSFIKPISVTSFFKDYWEKQPLHLITGRDEIARTVHHLFSKDILEHIVKDNDVRFIRDVCASCYKDKERRILNGEGKVKLSNLKRLMEKEKATIQFHQPQRFLDILWRMMEQLESKFGCLFGANVYMTPGGSQGLAPHYDDVEVFILQLEGQKAWCLYDPPKKLPRDYSDDLSEEDIGSPTHSIILKPGDLLYFPRGTVHHAATVEGFTHSTHITFSTYQHHTYSDYLSSGFPKMLGDAFESDVSFRRGLPVGTLASKNIDIKCQKTLEKLVQKLSKKVSATHEHALLDMKLDFVANRLPPYKDGNDIEEIQITPKGSHITHLRLKNPGHTFVGITGPSCQDTFRPAEPTPWNRDEEEEEDEDSSDEEEEDGKEEEKFFRVYHSFDNDRSLHMMTGDRLQPPALIFHMDLLEAFKKLETAGGQWVTVEKLNIKGNLDQPIFADLVEYWWHIHLSASS